MNDAQVLRKIGAVGHENSQSCNGPFFYFWHLVVIFGYRNRHTSGKQQPEDDPFKPFFKGIV